MRSRLCCVFGTWQLLSLVASFRQSTADRLSSSHQGCEDYLVLYETGGASDQFKASVAELASKIWDWKKIIWAYDFLKAGRKYGQLEILRVQRLIKSSVGLETNCVDEIWTCFVNRPSEKIILDLYPEAKIILYEDGLTSYLPVEQLLSYPPFNFGLNYLIFKGLIRILPAFQLRKGSDKVEQRHLKRVECFYSLLEGLDQPSALSKIHRLQVDASVMRALICDVSRDMPLKNIETTASSRPRILMLGQALSRNGIMPYEREAAIYQYVADQIIEKGYDIVWKEHPRVSKPFFSDLLNALASRGTNSRDRITEALIPYAFPVELIISQLNISGCVAGTSAALLYLKWLYNTEVFTFSEALVPFMSGADVMMSDMVESHIRPLSDLQFRVNA